MEEISMIEVIKVWEKYANPELDKVFEYLLEIVEEQAVEIAKLEIEHELFYLTVKHASKEVIAEVLEGKKEIDKAAMELCKRMCQREINQQREIANKKLDNLAEKVSKMRHLQKEYFKYRSRTLLNSAKSAENDVDMILKMIEKVRNI